MRMLIIDNYDSFTYNLFQYIAEVGRTTPTVAYNDKFSYKDFVAFAPDAVVISPGPGNPTNKKDFGISAEIIARAQVPILGVCLGHQGIGAMCGAKIVAAPEVMHGRVSKIYHNGKGLFRGIPQGFEAVRYHSLIISRKSLPKELEVIATAGYRGPAQPSPSLRSNYGWQARLRPASALAHPKFSTKEGQWGSPSSVTPRTNGIKNDGEVMGVQHKKRPLYGVQFHPESIGTHYGKQLIANFLHIVNTYEKA